MNKVFLVVVAFFFLVLGGTALADSWKELGESRVRLNQERDEIRVNDFATYDYLKLKVSRQGVEFRTVTVVFGNGTRKELPVRKFIAAGSETLPLRLPKGDRFIRKIILDYKTRTGANERAVVTVYGKRN